MSSPFPPSPPPPGPPYQPGLPPAGGYYESALPPAPPELRRVVILLLINLTLSILLTIVTVFLRNSLVNYQLDHRNITDPQQRELLRATYSYSIVARTVGNVIVSVFYAFLVRALLRGRRWAYRRVIWVGAAGIVGLVIIQSTPYPPWMRVEQLIQALVLAALLYCVTRPAVREHFAAHLPGRSVRRFRRG